MPAANFALEWDKDGERYFETGVKRGVLYPKTLTGSAITAQNGGYAAGVVWNGLTSVSESPEGGDANDMWADDIKTVPRLLLPVLSSVSSPASRSVSATERPSVPILILRWKATSFTSSTALLLLRPRRLTRRLTILRKE